ncbi:hypothetical protein [Thermoleptolyngbya sp. M55_K2018_002]|uniref:hypothetical protein n=1 Tax=Thermoleptolyngbya sp. M55_K2018_002 TaxID=2747808 RepID=UPI0019FE3F73|nr:hypothetical protein [Thermoleptolyngbya sp. M55_K2018_002]HIK38953.1 hypothetical protein [Thermoleptolyngbya sp. M55_K2018_002]
MNVAACERKYPFQSVAVCFANEAAIAPSPHLPPLQNSDLFIIIVGFANPLNLVGTYALAISALGFGQFLAGCAREKLSNCVSPTGFRNQDQQVLEGIV